MYIIFLDRYGDLMNKPVLFCQINTLYLGKNVGGPVKYIGPKNLPLVYENKLIVLFPAYS